MKPRRTQTDWPELLRDGMAVMLLIFAFAFRNAGLEISSVILFGIAGVVGLLAWLADLKRYRIIQGTPVSRIASASQGYARLAGYVTGFPGRLLISPLTGTGCVWYRCRIPGSNQRDIEEVESDVPFLLIDLEGQGQCVIEPTGAEVFTLRRTEWRRPESRALLRSKSKLQPLEIGVNHNLVFVDPRQMRGGDDDSSDNFMEWLLLPGDPIHALGYFISGEVGHGEAHIKADIVQRLSTWKENGKNLLERFDLNGDQQLDECEWRLARSAARREVLREHAATQSGGQQHRLCRPVDGRPFLLGAIPARLFARRYLFFALVNLAAFFAGLWGVGSGIQFPH